MEGEEDMEVLIHWDNGTAENATWEQASLIRVQFLEFHLEDKVAFGGRVMIDSKQ